MAGERVQELDLVAMIVVRALRRLERDECSDEKEIVEMEAA